jgi:hypothetical protein
LTPIADVCENVCSLFLASNGRGWALRNDHDLVTGQLVMEYVGEVITGEEVDMRMTEYKGKRHTYLLKLNTDEFIDSTRFPPLPVRMLMVLPMKFALRGLCQFQLSTAIRTWLMTEQL